MGFLQKLVLKLSNNSYFALASNFHEESVNVSHYWLSGTEEIGKRKCK